MKWNFKYTIMGPPVPDRKWWPKLYKLSTPTCQKCFKSAPCAYCGEIRVAHTSEAQTCPNLLGGYLDTTYRPTANWLEIHRCSE